MGPVKHTFFTRPSCGFPCSIDSLIECDHLPYQDGEQPTKWMNEQLLTAETST